jgi:prophage tail gpP-like protein
MSFAISVNGNPYVLWQNATVQRSLNSNAGAFSLSSSSTTPVSEYPVKEGDAIQITVGGVKKITGFVDEVTSEQEKDVHTVTVSGRDNTCDLIDSSVPDSAKVTEGPVSLLALCNKVITALGADIKVIETVSGIDDFTSEDLQAVETADKCMSYLVSFARKRQVYLVPDGFGKLLIYRPNPGFMASDHLVNTRNNQGNNVLSFDTVRSMAQRYNKIICRSQDNFGFNPLADILGGGDDRNGEAIDADIRESRYLEIISEESMDDTECKNRAAEESNLRRAAGKQYKATVAGVKQSSGLLWDIGQFVNINDEFAGWVGVFLIESVMYTQNARQGTKTVLSCVPPDAYQVEASESKATKRKAKTAGAFSR